MWNPSMCDCDCHKACKIDEYLDITKTLCKKRLFGEGEILNTTETLLNDKKSNMRKKIIVIFT